jgi:hypothetical protein
MNRYSTAKILPATDEIKRRYSNIKYPSILPSSNDIYIFISLGDRYDVLATSYYSDTSLWWVISRANPSQPTDTLYPTVGSQIRIPSPNRISTIMADFKNLNKY